MPRLPTRNPTYRLCMIANLGIPCSYLATKTWPCDREIADNVLVQSDRVRWKKSAPSRCSEHTSQHVPGVFAFAHDVGSPYLAATLHQNPGITASARARTCVSIVPDLSKLGSNEIVADVKSVGDVRCAWHALATPLWLDGFESLHGGRDNGVLQKQLKFITSAVCAVHYSTMNDDCASSSTVRGSHINS